MADNQKQTDEERRAKMREYSRKYRKRKGGSRNITIHLGSGEERTRRIKALDRLAGSFGFVDKHGKPMRSWLIQALCDDELVVKQKMPQRQS